MNLIQLKDYIKKVAERARNVDNIPKGLSPKQKIIDIEASLKLYRALTYILNIAEGKRSSKDKKDNLYWLP